MFTNSIDKISSLILTALFIPLSAYPAAKSNLKFVVDGIQCEPLLSGTSSDDSFALLVEAAGDADKTPELLYESSLVFNSVLNSSLKVLLAKRGIELRKYKTLPEFVSLINQVRPYLIESSDEHKKLIADLLDYYKSISESAIPYSTHSPYEWVMRELVPFLNRTVAKSIRSTALAIERSKHREKYMATLSNFVRYALFVSLSASRSAIMENVKLTPEEGGVVIGSLITGAGLLGGGALYLSYGSLDLLGTLIATMVSGGVGAMGGGFAAISDIERQKKRYIDENTGLDDLADPPILDSDLENSHINSILNSTQSFTPPVVELSAFQPPNRESDEEVVKPICKVPQICDLTYSQLAQLGEFEILEVELALSTFMDTFQSENFSVLLSSIIESSEKVIEQPEYFPVQKALFQRTHKLRTLLELLSGKVVKISTEKSEKSVSLSEIEDLFARKRDVFSQLDKDLKVQVDFQSLNSSTRLKFELAFARVIHVQQSLAEMEERLADMKSRFQRTKNISDRLKGLKLPVATSQKEGWVRFAKKLHPLIEELREGWNR